MNKKFWITLVLLSGLLTALGFLRTSTFKEREQDVIAVLQAGLPPAGISFLQVISDYGKIINIGVPAVFLILGLVKRRRILTLQALIVLLGMSLAGVIVQSIKRAVKEPRPYEVDSRIRQLSDGGKNSFPSGHTAEVTASMLGVSLLLLEAPLIAVAATAWAILMMFSRIALGVHNFTDIAAGIVTGCIGFLIIRQIFSRWVGDKTNTG